MIKLGSKCVIKALKIFYNAFLFERRTPEQWNYTVMIILHKMGDMTEIENYRFISLLSYLYKLFMKIITNKLGPLLDNHQQQKQARFRSDFGMNDHLQVIKSWLEKVRQGCSNKENIGINNEWGVSEQPEVCRQHSLHCRSSRSCMSTPSRPSKPLHMSCA